ncbi:aldo/keto reductase [Sodalis praecaptivus]|uniref:aldo/keto reductase n=1 Tax=Sodalis praecaptivus TaxID=1239307 RepID=UPI0027E67663|nr:aldo/keto reductase [Sodalis praecaptivus]CAJ0998297.1 Pyridoxine 4-dehydrogenase [Sodalis praecaptivus]
MFESALTYRLGNRQIGRMGYGAMQLAGPGAYGPPADETKAIQVLRDAVEAGVRHIDTSDFYGPHITNRLIKKALYPYPDDLCIVTKVGAKRDAQANWLPAMSGAELTRAVEDNLRHLGLEALEVVNLRSMLDAQKMTPIVCVQNLYNVANRHNDALIDSLAAQGIAWVPFFPLGGFSPLQSTQLNEVAQSLNATPMQVALAWLLQRAPNILLIPGTSSPVHLQENLASARLALPADALTKLDGIATPGV